VRIVVGLSIVIVIIMFDGTVVVVDIFVSTIGGWVDCACCLWARVEKKEFHWAVLHSILLWIAARLTGCCQLWWLLEEASVCIEIVLGLCSESLFD